MLAWLADGTPVGDTVTLEEGRVTLLHAPTATLVRLGPRELTRVGDAWEIPVGLWASGRTHPLHLVGPGGTRTVTATVRPAAHKLSPDQWAVMVEEVEGLLAGAILGAEGGVDGGIGAEGIAEGVRIEVLTTLVPELLRALRTLTEHPRRRDAEQRHEVPLHEVRRADAATARAWARTPAGPGGSPSAGAATRTAGSGAATAPLSAAPLLPGRLAVERLDHPANRWIAGRLRAVIRAFAAAARRLAAATPADDLDRDRVAWAHARARRCDDAARALQRLLDDTFLGQLRPGEAGESVLPAFGDPIYVRVHRLIRVLLHPRFRLDADGPAAALRPSYTLWELWCFQRVIAEQAALRPGWKRTQALAPLRGSTGGGARVTLSDGEDEVDITFNPTFPGPPRAEEKVPSDRFSLSRELRPDITVRARVGGRAWWWVYDAKWRVGRTALGDAFDSVHRYRDALVDLPHGGRPVGAWLLTPSAGDAPGQWTDPAWQARWGMGVLERVPGRADGAHEVLAPGE